MIYPDKLLFVFLCGASYELGCVFWVHYSETHQIGKAAIWSGFNALVTILGIEGALQTLPLKIAFILGYVVGTAVAVTYKKFKSQTSS